MLNNRYKIIAPLGSGGFAEVYQALDMKQDPPTKIAIKKMLPQSNVEKRRFYREFKFLNSINHPNLLKAYDFFIDEKHLCVALELVEGETLQDLIEFKKNPVYLIEQLAIANQIARGIEVLNRGGIIHRDIKPQNIMVDYRRGMVKILDLGIAKDLKSESTKLTLNSEVLGTLAYMSPEQGDGNVSIKSDIFSLGITLYQFFSWSKDSPFHHTDPFNVLVNIDSLNPPTVYELVEAELANKPEDEIKAYKDVSEVIAKAMQKLPQNRWESTGDMALEFVKIQRSLKSQRKLDSKNFTMVDFLTPQLISMLDKLKKECQDEEVKVKKKRSTAKSKIPRRSHKMETKKQSMALVYALGVLLLAATIFLLYLISLPGTEKKKKQISTTSLNKNPVSLKVNKKLRKHFQAFVNNYNKGLYKQAWQEISAICKISKESKFHALKAVMLYKGEGTKANRTKAQQMATSLFHQTMQHNQKAVNQYAVAKMYQYGVGVKQSLPKSRSWYQKAAEKGLIEATYALGHMYFFDKTTADHLKWALNWLTKAAIKEHPIAMFYIGNMYEFGTGVKKDIDKAILWLEKSANKGYLTAIRNLVSIYRDPQKKRLNSQKAIFWCTKAAEMGDARALSDMGSIYLNGRGAKKDFKKAGQYFKAAAAKGIPQAAYNMGVLYGRGLGVKKDKAKSKQWFQKSASLYQKKALKGDVDSMLRLGILYQTGEGVEKNSAQALYWYRKAANNKNTNAMLSLGVYYEGKGAQQNHQKSLRWFKKAAQQGNNTAILKVGLAYFYGKGVEKSSKIALKWFIKAAQRGDVNGMMNTAQVYEQEGDFPPAFRFFKQAALKGHRVAMKKVAQMYKQGKGVTASLQEAQKWYKRAEKK